ncbi:MAG: hypothetical protein M3N24_10830 [Actinomycetota bacterium]|nr:hypothetical protein [Actinomycetota bacterium]
MRAVAIVVLVLLVLLVGFPIAMGMAADGNCPIAAGCAVSSGCVVILLSVALAGLAFLGEASLRFRKPRVLLLATRPDKPPRVA